MHYERFEMQVRTAAFARIFFREAETSLEQIGSTIAKVPSLA
jgi:hypothetical protein